MFLSRLKPGILGISTKLTLAYSLVLISSFFILFGILYFKFRWDLQNQEYAFLENKASSFRERLENRPYKNFRKGEQDAPLFVVLYSPRGEPLIIDEAMPSLKIDPDFLKMELLKLGQAQGRMAIPETYGSNMIFAATLTLSDGNKLIVAKSSEELLLKLNYLLNLFSWFLLPVLLLGFLGGWFLSVGTLKPVRELIATMKKIESGSLSTRVPVGRSYDELEELKLLSNKMLDKIENLVNGLKEAFDHLAHDIRTPVTRLRGRAELALTNDADVDVYREALQSCYENSDKILNFLQVLTDITEAENRSKKLKLEKKFISDLVREMMSLYEMSFEEKDVKVTQNLDSGDWAMVDSRLISRVIANLLDNAFKYTPKGGEVTIQTVNQTEAVILRVTDTGPGISSEEQSLIWQKLYRSDKSRSEYGMGLGLTFVRAVVEAHDGKVSVRSPVKEGRGTEFEVVLQKMS